MPFKKGEEKRISKMLCQIDFYQYRYWNAATSKNNNKNAHENWHRSAILFIYLYILHHVNFCSHLSQPSHPYILFVYKYMHCILILFATAVAVAAAATTTIAFFYLLVLQPQPLKARMLLWCHRVGIYLYVTKIYSVKKSKSNPHFIGHNWSLHHSAMGDAHWKMRQPVVARLGTTAAPETIKTNIDSLPEHPCAPPIHFISNCWHTQRHTQPYIYTAILAF